MAVVHTPAPIRSAHLQSVSNVRLAHPALEAAVLGVFKQRELDGIRCSLGPIVPWDEPAEGILDAAKAAVVEDRFRRQYSGQVLFQRLRAAALIRQGYSLAYVKQQTLLSIETVDEIRTELRLVELTEFKGADAAGKVVPQC